MRRLALAALAGVACATPARADFFNDVRRIFQKDIPRTFEQDIPRFFGAKPKTPPVARPGKTSAKLLPDTPRR